MPDEDKIIGFNQNNITVPVFNSINQIRKKNKKKKRSNFRSKTRYNLSLIHIS